MLVTTGSLADIPAPGNNRTGNVGNAGRLQPQTLLAPPETQDPTTAYATPPQPKQQQEMPGKTEGWNLLPTTASRPATATGG